MEDIHEPGFYVVAHYGQDHHTKDRKYWLTEDSLSTDWFPRAKLHPTVESATKTIAAKEFSCRANMGDNHPMLGKYFIEQVCLKRVKESGCLC